MTRPSRMAQVLIACAVLAVPTALLADPSDDGISRAPSGFVLHQRLPTAANAAGAPDPTPSNGPQPSPDPTNATNSKDPARPADDTPRFVYDPNGAGGVPGQLPRDDGSAQRPSTALTAAPGEPVHTADGLKPPQTADARPPGLGPPTPLPEVGPNTVNDPSAPFPANTPTPPTAADAVATPGDAGDPAASLNAAADPSAATDPSLDPTPGPEAVDPNSDPRESMGDTAAPDRRTQKEGTLHYHETFDPSIVPYKRGRALNEVTSAYDIRLDLGRMQVLEPTGNRVDAGHEAFWGSVLLEGPANARIPLPSVSPESRILSYEANPPQTVRFERDEAGNFYVTPQQSGRLRLVFVMDAPSRYFGRPLPHGARLSDVPNALRPHLPRAAQREAREVATIIGVPTSGDFAATLNHLVGYFRSFKPGEPPPATGSIYRDIALGKKGVCRHRAHGFVITAQALGIPAHYVFNEAHVFVEVWVPFGRDEAQREGSERGAWLRVDLGGGADALEMQGGEGKTLHHPNADPFSQPDGFDPDQLAGATRIDGLPDDPGGNGTAGGQPGPGGAGPDGTTAAGGQPGGPDDPDGLFSDDPLGDGLGDPYDPSNPVGPGDNQPGGSQPGAPGVTRVTPQPELTATRTTLGITQSIVFRGESLALTGRVQELSGAPVREGQVHVVLLGPTGQALADLGTVSLRPDGRYALEVPVPAAQAPGNYQIVAEFLGNGVQGPSVSE